jgi:hypothetical protein
MLIMLILQVFSAMPRHSASGECGATITLAG